MDAPETDTCGPESVDCGGADLDVAISASNSTFPPEAIIFVDASTRSRKFPYPFRGRVRLSFKTFSYTLFLKD